MSEKEFIEDDIDRIMDHRIPITTNSFKGLWALSALFSRKKPERMEKLKKKVDESEKLMVPPEKTLETISI